MSSMGQTVVFCVTRSVTRDGATATMLLRFSVVVALAAGSRGPPPAQNCRDTSLPFGCTPESRQTECVDVVSYFQIAADGAPSFVARTDDAESAELDGYTFLFSSAANRALFEADPWKYAPAYGGF